MAKGDCSICEHPDGARVVNRLLEQKVKLRDISNQTGFSKSSVHRHSVRCIIRAQAQKIKSSRFDPKSGRVFVQWPDNDPSCPADVCGKIFNWYGGREIPPDQIRENDVILRVEYEKTIEFGNPRGLSADVAFDLAKSENADRDAVKPETVN